MVKGLDGLVEWLIAEIAYGGEKGLSVGEFVTTVERFRETQQVKSRQARLRQGSRLLASTPAANEQPSATTDLALARKAWEWTVVREEILVGRNRSWNCFSLDEVLALPEEEQPLPEDEDGQVLDPKLPQPKPRVGVVTARGADKKAPSKPTTRPRISVTEKTQWLIITGHDVDYKKIPRLEFACLVGIASSQYEGIVQGDLRRLVDQDKRSVPKRTDFLAMKGYIIKRTSVEKGQKTSRLWLRGFAPADLPLVNSHASGIDLSPETLRQDEEPVPWHGRWMEGSIDYPSFGQTFLAIAKSFGVMRMVTLKMKMGVAGYHWQMRVLARECRRFAGFGVLKYVAATMAGDRRVFKDCIKYIRDPTDEEFQLFLACGKKTSQYSDATRDRQPKMVAKPKQNSSAQAGDEDDLDEEDETAVYDPSIVENWEPEKPLTNTMFELIRQAGSEGVSCPSLSRATVGYSFRRIIFAQLQNHAAGVLDSPQSPHLNHLQLRADLVRKGKTTAYMFKVAHGGSESADQGSAQDSTEIQKPVENMTNRSSNSRDRFGFPPPAEELIHQDKAMTVSDLSHSTERLARPTNNGKKRWGRWKKLGSSPTRNTQPVFREATPLRISFEDPTAETNSPARLSKTPSAEPQQPAPITHSTHEQEGKGVAMAPRMPEVVIGEPGSLTPAGRKVGRGRKKKSLVLIIRSDKIKDAIGRGTNRASGDLSAAVPTQKGTSSDKPFPGEVTVELGDIVLDAPSSKNATQSPSPPRTQFVAVNGNAVTTAGSATALHSGEYEIQLLAKHHLVRASYKGSTGRLYITGNRERIRFEFDDEDAAEGLLTLLVSDLTEDPLFHKVPGNGRYAIVLQAQENHSEKTRLYIFQIGDVEGQEQNAASFRTAIMQSRNSVTANTAEADPKEAPVGGGPGRGSRKRKAAKISSDDGYKCEKCGGLWKNELGLRYHQTKSKTVCNPDFLSVDATNTSRKRRRVSRSVFAFRDNVNPSTTPHKSLHRWLRRRQQRAVGRGWVAVSARPQGDIQLGAREWSPEPGLSHQPKDIPRLEDASDPIPGSSASLSAEDASLDAGQAVKRAGATAINTVSTRNQARTSAEGKTTASKVEAPNSRRPGKGKAGPEKDPSTASRSNDSTSTAIVPQDQTTKAIQTTASSTQHHKGQSASVAQTSAVSQAAKPSALSGAVPDNETEFRMPAGIDTTGMTASKIKTYKVTEIVRYLLRRTGGVFPSEKGLWYAVFAVFARTFPEEDWLHQRATFLAIRNLEKGNEALEHTFGFKDANGKFDHFRLITWSDLKISDPLVVSMKQKVQAAHPKVYVPPEFEPTDEELAALQAFDAEQPTPRRRKPQRRILGDEVEFLEAPVYEASRVAYSARKASVARDFLSFVDDAPSSVRAERPLRRADDEGMPGRVTKKARIDRRGKSSLEKLTTVKEATTSEATPANAFQFLEPNTRLDDDPFEGSLQGSDPPIPTPAWSVLSDSAAQLHGRADPFTRTVVLQGARDPEGVWPRLDERYFLQHGDASFVVSGWMPARAVLWRQQLPQSLKDIPQAPRCTFTPSNWADPDWAGFCFKMDDISRWETSEAGKQSLLSGSVAPSYIFINAPILKKHQNVSPADLRWRDKNQWTVDWPPEDEMLEEQLEHHSFRPSARAATGGGRLKVTPVPLRAGRGRVGFPRLRHGPPRSSLTRGRKADASDKLPPEAPLPLFTQKRTLTSYRDGPQDPFPDTAFNENDLDWKAENVRIASFVTVRTLLGGVNKSVDWGIMQRLYPDSTVSNLKKFWADIKKERLPYINKMTERFQQAFLVAYKKSDLPPLDYDNTLDYDWRRMVAWTVNLALDDAPNLPATREALWRGFSLSEESHHPRDWRENFYHWQRSVWNRFQDANSQAATMVLREQIRPVDAPMLARSWVRALSCTEFNKYPPVMIRDKLLKLGARTSDDLNKLLEGTVKRLQVQRVIKTGKVKVLRTGRPYVLSDLYWSSLEKHAHAEKFKQAADYKTQLDERFRRHEAVEVEWTGSDGMTMVLINLHAQGRITMEPVNLRDIPFGFEPGNYESRRFPKGYHYFSMRVEPTDRYVYTEDTDILNSVKRAGRPGEGMDGLLPIWCDIFGVVDNIRWTKIVASVAFVLGTKGAMRARHLASVVKPMLDTFEVEMVVAWAVHCGLLVQNKASGALLVSEWWWLIVAGMLGEAGIVRLENNHGDEI